MSRSVWRAGWPPAAIAFGGSTAAVWVNLTTEWKTVWWAWLLVVLSTIVVAGISVRAEVRREPPTPPSDGGQSVTGSTVLGSVYQVGSVSGDVRIER